MSHPDASHDPENVRDDDLLRAEEDFRRWEDDQEWLAHQHDKNDPLTNGRKNERP